MGGGCCRVGCGYSVGGWVFIWVCLCRCNTVGGWMGGLALFFCPATFVVYLILSHTRSRIHNSFDNVVGALPVFIVT